MNALADKTIERHGQRPSAIPLQYRTGYATREGGLESRTYQISFSSEDPFYRWWLDGHEVLGHEDGEVDMEWMASGRAPLLQDHRNSLDAQIGVIERAWIQDRRGMAKVRLARTEAGDRAKVLIDDGIVSAVSVGYIVERVELVATDTDGGDTYRVTRWKPREASLVSVPADTTVGVGRADDDRPTYPLVIARSTGMSGPTSTAPTGAPTDDAETARRQAMLAFAKRFDDPGDPESGVLPFSGTAIAAEVMASGGDLNALQARINADYTAWSNASNAQSDQYARRTAPARLTPEWSDRRVLQDGFSFQRAIVIGAGMVGNAIEEAPPEMKDGPERSLLTISTKSRDRVRIPYEVLDVPDAVIARYLQRQQQRALVVDTGSNAANLVGIDHMGGSFIDLLRNMSAVMPQATLLGDLQGDADVPRQTGAASASWLDENTTETPMSDPQFDQLALSPKELGIRTRFSRKTLIQSSPDVEMLLRMDFAEVAALAIDAAALDGPGGLSPTGVMRTPDVNTLAFGGDANTGGAPSWTNMVSVIEKVLGQNAVVIDPSMAMPSDACFVSNSAVWKTLKVTPKVDGEPEYILGEDGRVCGFAFKLSNQAPRNVAKGNSDANLSKLLFGRIRDIIIGLWSGLDLLPDPYSRAAFREIELHAWQDVDTAVRRPQSFCVVSDVQTAE